MRGNLELPDKLKQFSVGKTTAQDVISACGSPSLRVTPLTWIYITCRSEEVSFRNVEMKDKLIIRMTFDNNGVLRSMEKIKNKSKNGDLLPDEDATDIITEKSAKKYRGEPLSRG